MPVIFYRIFKLHCMERKNLIPLVLLICAFTAFGCKSTNTTTISLPDQTITLSESPYEPIDLKVVDNTKVSIEAVMKKYTK